MATPKKTRPNALSVVKGVAQPSSLNDGAAGRIRSLRSKLPDEDGYLEGILSGNRSILGQAITLVESSLDKHRVLAQKVIDKCLPHSGNSIRVGITGVPGVGKSTFIEVFGTFLTSHGHKVAVLAIDPSSGRSKGSILGDKTRMENLSIDPNAFIRPSPSGGSLGGVARKTRESVILCEAAGYDIIIIETVGVGQSEIAVHSMTDFFLLLMLAGAGDELQGIKRGIMEMADLIAINKADGTNVENAIRAKAQYQNALHLFPSPSSGWTPGVVTCSMLTKDGIEEVWQSITEYKKLTFNNYFHKRRAEQSKYWMLEAINDQLYRNFYGDDEISDLLKTLEKEVTSNRMSPFTAAGKLLEKYAARLSKSM